MSKSPEPETRAKIRVPLSLETRRLWLRQFRHDDWRGLHEYYGDRRATRYTFARPLTEGDSWRIMCAMIGHWQLRGYGPYAVERKRDGQLLGTVGFWYPVDWPEAEIKWALARRYWGRGYASEAARAVQAAGRSHLPETALISMIHPKNQASSRLALALGASLEKEVEYEGESMHVYRHPRGD